MKVLIVFDHPRRTSLCGAVLDRFVAGLHEAGHQSEIADLRAEGFDPRLGVEDEPDRDAQGKIYSPAVLAEQDRVMRNDALALIFPVWWWSLPATSKGWIDRVWNRDWAYGNRKLTLQKAVLIGLAAADAGQYAKRSYDTAMQAQLVQGVLAYCGIADASLELLHGTTGPDSDRAALLARARLLGRTF